MIVGKSMILVYCLVGVRADERVCVSYTTFTSGQATRMQQMFSTYRAGK